MNQRVKRNKEMYYILLLSSKIFFLIYYVPNKTDNRTDLFAATPPLEALKLLISMCMMEGIGWNQGEDKRMTLDFIDVRRAYFHARS